MGPFYSPSITWKLKQGHRQKTWMGAIVTNFRIFRALWSVFFSLQVVVKNCWSSAL